MELLKSFVDLFLHLDKHLDVVIQDYGAWTYLILLVIIFCETGLVITPFLPGDSLLFAAGTFAARGSLDVHLLFVLLAAAAIAGDTANYWIGAVIGPRAFSGKYRLLNQRHLQRTHEFYERHGGKTIVLARFIPIIRTFAPFVAGIGAMNYTGSSCTTWRAASPGCAFRVRRVFLWRAGDRAAELHAGDSGHHRDFGAADRRGIRRAWWGRTPVDPE